MTISLEHISSMADRVRRGAASSVTLTDAFVSAVVLAWRDGSAREDAETIMRHWPALFPLVGGRQAE